MLPGTACKALVAGTSARYISAMLPAPFRSVDLRLLLMLILAISLGALVMALIGQYAFGLEPCILCLYERVPWAAAAVVAAIGLSAPPCSPPGRLSPSTTSGSRSIGGRRSPAAPVAR